MLCRKCNRPAAWRRLPHSTACKLGTHAGAGTPTALPSAVRASSNTTKAMLLVGTLRASAGPNPRYRPAMPCVRTVCEADVTSGKYAVFHPGTQDKYCQVVRMVWSVSGADTDLLDGLLTGAIQATWRPHDKQHAYATCTPQTLPSVNEDRGRHWLPMQDIHAACPACTCACRVG